MFAVTAARLDAGDPLAGLDLGEHAEPAPPDGWTTVTVKAAALNHHDVWSLRGVGLPADRLPMILGCDAAGVDADGREVVVHAVIGDPAGTGGDETLDPRRSLLSERYDGTFAERVAVPRRNLVPKPAALTFEQAACLPTAYLTAYRMLFDRAGLAARSDGPGPGRRRGSGHGADPARPRGRVPGVGDEPEEARRARALELGADQAFESGARLPERVDAVMETVGEATWAHSLRALRARRHHRGLGRDQRPGAAGGAEPGVLPAALGGRLNDGQPRSAGPAADLP